MVFSWFAGLIKTAHGQAGFQDKFNEKCLKPFLTDHVLRPDKTGNAV